MPRCFVSCQFNQSSWPARFGIIRNIVDLIMSTLELQTRPSNSSLQTEVCIQFCAQGGGMMSDTYPSDKISSNFWFMTTRVRKFCQSTLKQNTGVVKMCGPCTRRRVRSQGWEDGKYLLLKDSLLFIKCCWTTVQLDMLLIQGILELKALRWGNWLGDWKNIGAIMIHHVISCTVSCRSCRSCRSCSTGCKISRWQSQSGANRTWPGSNQVGLANSWGARKNSISTAVMICPKRSEESSITSKLRPGYRIATPFLAWE